MPYLVSSLPPPKDGQLRLVECSIYDAFTDDTENLSTAMLRAEDLVETSHTQVQVWALKGSLEAVTVSKWTAAEASNG